MTDLETLEQSLAAHGGEDTGDNLPAGFRQATDGLRVAGPGSAAVLAERKRHIDTATWLLRQLDDADNLVVKQQKRWVIRGELNAVRFLDTL